MGGCRCSYPNCTVKSDGVTHMFHYPVFDRVRCHQWLVNTNRLEFLNLKVSQLKNRVICQHHFKDSYFMNFKKEKLKFDAVPTEKGPFCDIKVENTTEEVPKLYDISLDDIENELIYCEDKKANFSVKYGSFLTNCDLSELDTLNQINKNYSREEKIKEHSNFLIDIDGKNHILNNVVSSYDNLQGASQNSIMNAPSIFEGINPNVVSIEFEDVNTLDQKEQKKKPVFNTNNQTLNINKTNSKNVRKIRIISEKKISEPISIIGKLEPVSPSLVLRVLDKKKKIKYDNKTNHEVTRFTRNVQKKSNDLLVIEEDEKLNIQQKLQEIMKIDSVGTNCNEDNFLKTSNTSIELHNNTVNDIELSKNNLSYYETQTDNKGSLLSQNIADNKASLLLQNIADNKASLLPKNIANKKITENNQINVKRSLRQDKTISYPINKIPAARVAAIDKKRKFNMKLRDIIESCLDKIDDEDKLSDESKTIDKIKETINNKPQNKSYSKQKDLSKSNVQEYPLAFLETRIKTMEENLMNKIDQNSQKIIDLKNSFFPVTKNKLAPTLTLAEEISHKKYLYQEISKYLSPEANNLIYEELFINKIVQKVPKGSSPSKRRRCR